MNFYRFILLPSSILVAIIGVFLLVPNALALLAFRPESFIAGEFWRIVTYPFVHMDANHLFENIVALIVASLLAYEVEMTTAQYVVAFAASVFVVAIADLVYFPALLVIGASAAIFAVYGAFAMKGSVFITKGWLVPILAVTIWTKYGMNLLTSTSVDQGLLAQTLLHFLGFATGVGAMIVCLEIARATRRRVLT
jgi:membrane associated rhomboid family serine protease